MVDTGLEKVDQMNRIMIISHHPSAASAQVSQQQAGNYGIMVLPENETVNPTTTNATQNKQKHSPGHLKHRLEELVAEYPCLWDRRDLNYTDRTLRTQCQEQLLVKYNSLSSITITMEQLKRKLEALRCRLSRRRRGKLRTFQGSSDIQVEKQITTDLVQQNPVGKSNRRLGDLATEYPCLWNRKDPNFHNRTMKFQCLKQLLVKFNSESSIPITMERLISKIQSFRVWRKRQEAIGQNRSANQGPSGEDSRGNWSDVGTSSDSTGPVNKIQRVAQKNPQTGLFTIVFHCCGVCGEVKSEDLKVEDKPYMVNNKIKLTMNDLSIDLDFDKDTTVCQNCDVKLKEMYEFVKLVKNAQDKINSVCNIVDETEEITIDDDNIDSVVNEDQKFIVDSLTVTDTEIVKPTVVQKRKCEEFPEVKKKFKVTIDLNSCDDNISNDRSTMDDIEAKYQIFKKGDVPFAKSKESADEVSKVTITVNSKDIDVKKEIEHDSDIVSELTRHSENYNSKDIVFDIKNEKVTDDIKEVDETVEISDDDRNDIVSEHTRVSEDIIYDVEKENVTDDILKEVDKAGGIVTNEDKRNDTNVVICDSGKTNEMAIISDVAINEPVCVMPKSELIQLMESIVSRMLNK